MRVGMDVGEGDGVGDGGIGGVAVAMVSDVAAGGSIKALPLEQPVRHKAARRREQIETSIILRIGLPLQAEFPLLDADRLIFGGDDFDSVSIIARISVRGSGRMYGRCPSALGWGCAGRF
jgi:hypothetical protein